MIQSIPFLKFLSPRNLAVAGMVVLVGIGLWRIPSVHAASRQPGSGEHIITLHEGTAKRGFYTKATTLRDALREANVRLDDKDRTEPELDTPLESASYEVNIYRARPVVIRDGGADTKLITAYRTGKQIAEQAGIPLHDEDQAVLARSRDIIADGAAEVMAIRRATPFKLVFYGKTIQAYTMEKTVGAMLKAKKITLGADDTLSVPASAPLTAGMTVELWRNGKQTVTVEEEVDFKTEEIKDADRERGKKEVKTEGKKGKKAVTYEIIMKNGREESRKQLSSVVTQEPVNRVEIVGTKKKSVDTTFSGDFAGALAKLRSCEGGYTSNTGNGYYGAYQFDIKTWGGFGGYANAAEAPPEVQDQKAWETYQRRGWQPWPTCKNKMGLQDIYR